MVLGKYDSDQITGAFVEWIGKSSRFPTAHDIVAIIDPSVLPLSESVYREVSKRGREQNFMTKDEQNFVNEFERREFAKIN